MKTKYIKVAVSERLPEKEGKYFLWVDNPNARGLESEELSMAYNMENKHFKEGEFQTFYETTHWLQEVPDREQDMKEMLEELVSQIQTFTKGNIGEQEYFDSSISQAKELLNTLKQ